MESTRAWRECFENWPAEVRRRGVLVTSFGEQISFADFMTSPGIVLIERTSPDPIGARMVLVPYDSILGLKITDPLQPAALRAMGFVGKSAAK